MKLRFLIFETKASAWVEDARRELEAKIAGFAKFEIVKLKSLNADRDDALVKLRREAEILFKNIDERELLVLFDEAGVQFPSSEDFAAKFVKLLESGKTTITFCIGGPYGFDESVKKRAQARWSLSRLTLNHWIAQLTALEQIYRAFTIIKGIPYHNR